MQEASRLAGDLPEVQARLDQIKHYLRYMHLRWLLDHERQTAAQRELTLAILELTYRTRYEYMNHWAALRYTFAAEAAEKFKEPGWRREDKSRKPSAASHRSSAPTAGQSRAGGRHCSPNASKL